MAHRDTRETKAAKQETKANQKTAKGQLTAKEERFVFEYLKDHNAEAAARRAGYADTTARGKAHSWVCRSRDRCPANKQHVWDAVQQGTEALRDDNKDTVERLIEEYERLAFQDTANIKAFAKLGTEFTVKDKLKAMSDLARIMGMFKDNVRLSDPNGDPLTLVLQHIDGATGKISTNKKDKKVE